MPDEPINTVNVTTTNSAPPLEAGAMNRWSFSASAYTYFVYGEQDYVQPTLTADHGWLHLEARYNYEALDTSSAWVGYNFSGGGKLAWELTPMMGGVFGDIDGIAPGYKGSLSWWKLELYSEGEYVYDTNVRSDSFFYNWSELTLSPVDWFRFGMVTQRTRAYQSDVEIQRGFLVGLAYKKTSLTTYVFNPDESHPTVVLAVTLIFQHTTLIAVGLFAGAWSWHQSHFRNRTQATMKTTREQNLIVHPPQYCYARPPQ